MHSKSDLFDGLYVFLTWVMRFVMINILWFATNLPSLLIIFNLFFGKGRVILSIGLLIACHVLLFYPSMTALYTVVNDWITKKDYEYLFKKYVNAFLNHYDRSIKAGLIWTIIAVIWVVDYVFFAQVSGILEAVILVIGALLFCMSLLYLTLFIQNTYSMRDMFKLSLHLTLTEPLVFLTIVLSFIVLLWTSIYFMWFAIPFFIASLHTFIVLTMFYKWMTPAKIDQREESGDETL